jgi:predicted nucleotidyltransferase
MVSRRDIKRFANEVARQFKPERIILFGSYAYVKPTPDSDVDLLVILPYDRRQGRMALRILEAIGYRFPLDLLVRTPPEVQQRLRWGDCFMEEVIRKGKVLYEAAHA